MAVVGSRCCVAALLALGCGGDANPGLQSDAADHVIDATPAPDADASEPDAGTDPTARSYDESAWFAGTTPAGRIAPTHIVPLGGAMQGPPMWVSNNPERVLGAGWTMQNARADATRGGAPYPLDGAFSTYVFHLNATGQTAYFHLLASNPQTAPVQVSARGIFRTNADEPLSGAGTGPSFAVARAWLADDLDLNVDAVSIDSNRAASITRVAMPPASMLDGRVELMSTAGVYLYGVVSFTDDADDAINLSQGGPADGEIVSPGPNEYGREAGVFGASEWRGDTNLEVPAAPAHIGLAFATNAKFALDGVHLQEQTVAAAMRLNDSADRSWGNYGVRYQLQLRLHNPGTSERQVQVSFAHNIARDSDQPSFTWNGPARYNGILVTLFTTPRQPRRALGQVTLAPGEVRTVSFDAYVPGLITAGAHLLLESL